jgi:hypothetical protein
VAKALGSSDVAVRDSPVDPAANVFEVVAGAPHLTAVLRKPGSGPSGAVKFSFAGSVERLLDGDFSRRFGSP